VVKGRSRSKSRLWVAPLGDNWDNHDQEVFNSSFIIKLASCTKLRLFGY
jgi:hypothetical protein